jgi:hypothetical protein
MRIVIEIATNHFLSPYVVFNDYNSNISQFLEKSSEVLKKYEKNISLPIVLFLIKNIEYLFLKIIKKARSV